MDDTSWPIQLLTPVNQVGGKGGKLQIYFHLQKIVIKVNNSVWQTAKVLEQVPYCHTNNSVHKNHHASSQVKTTAQNETLVDYTRMLGVCLCESATHPGDCNSYKVGSNNVHSHQRTSHGDIWHWQSVYVWENVGRGRSSLQEGKCSRKSKQGGNSATELGVLFLRISFGIQHFCFHLWYLKPGSQSCISTAEQYLLSCISVFKTCMLRLISNLLSINVTACCDDLEGTCDLAMENVLW